MLQTVCPFQWWEQTVKDNAELKVVADLARLMLAHPRTSSLSEFIFSYGGSQTSGKRSMLSSKRLHARQIIKFNHKLVKDNDWEELPKVVSSVREWSKKGYGRWQTKEETDAYLIREVTCASCTNVQLTRMKCTAAYAGVVCCDSQNCVQDIRKIVEGAYFYACKNCDQFDICRGCYDNIKDNISITSND